MGKDIERKDTSLGLIENQVAGDRCFGGNVAGEKECERQYTGRETSNYQDSPSLSKGLQGWRYVRPCRSRLLTIHSTCLVVSTAFCNKVAVMFD